MNDLTKTKPSNEEALQLGLSLLHCRIKCMEYILHIAYNLSFECWWTSKKKRIQNVFINKLGIRVDFASFIEMDQTHSGNRNLKKESGCSYHAFGEKA